MASIQMGVKKELSNEEFHHVLVAFKESVEGDIDLELLAKSLEIFVKEISPAKEVHLFILSEDGNSAKTVMLEKNINIDISLAKGMIVKSIETKKPQFTNDIRRYNDYNEEIDNIFDYPLKNLLVMPVLDIDKKIFAIIWAAIPKGDLNQYIQLDIEHLTELIDEIEYVEQKQMIENDSSKSKIATKDKIDVQIVDIKVDKTDSSMVKKIKSWLFK